MPMSSKFGTYLFVIIVSFSRKMPRRAEGGLGVVGVNFPGYSDESVAFASPGLGNTCILSEL